MKKKKHPKTQSAKCPMCDKVKRRPYDENRCPVCTKCHSEWDCYWFKCNGKTEGKYPKVSFDVYDAGVVDYSIDPVTDQIYDWGEPRDLALAKD